MPDYDPRLVELYDNDNPDGPDREFFRLLANELGARKVVDLGCGTGMLTVSLCATARTVVGIDPSRSMLDYARARPGAESVTWILGDSGAIGDAKADLMVMSGNVAQHITGDAWLETLKDACNGLQPGGVLTFERRNPGAREWESWAKEGSYTRDTTIGELTEWMEVESIEPAGNVAVAFHNLFTASGEQVTERQTFSFLSQAEVSADLEAAGFDVYGVWSGWHREPFQPSSPLMLFEARRR